VRWHLNLSVVLILGCGGGRREEAPAASGELALRIALEVAPVSLNPLLADGQSIGLVGDIYESLLCQPVSPAGCLADEVRVSADGRTFDITVRDARFHDGTIVDADDVIATLGVVTGAGQSYLGAELADVEAVEKVSARQVRIRFAAARPGRGAALARVPILPAEALSLLGPGGLAAAPISRRPVGSGPLVVTSIAPDRIELSRWRGYWGPPAGSARVVYVVAADRADALRRLRRGEVDLVGRVPLEQARAEPWNGRVVEFFYTVPAMVVAVYNAQRPALSSPEQRRALTALLDRAAIARSLLGSTAPVPTAPLSLADPGIDPAIAAVPFDPVLAQKAWSAPPALEVLVPVGSRIMARTADIWAADARGAVTLSVRQEPFAEVLQRLREGRFDIALLSLTLGPDLDLWPQLSSRAPRDLAWTGITDGEMDAILDELRAELDPALRDQLRRRLHRRWSELVPMALIAYDVRVGLAAREVRGLDSAGAPPLASRLSRSSQ
jgi:peptide/nickel transport system substrate-binding protein